MSRLIFRHIATEEQRDRLMDLCMGTSAMCGRIKFPLSNGFVLDGGRMHNPSEADGKEFHDFDEWFLAVRRQLRVFGIGEPIEEEVVQSERPCTKATNPKDAVGSKKWRIFSTISGTVLAELGVAMMEGALKYGRHNYRHAGVRASVYYDASIGHLMQWWEGEDKDPDTGLSHVTKAIASLVVLRDAMIEGKLNDDRPIKANLEGTREELQTIVDEFLARTEEPKQPYTEVDHGS